MNKLLLLRLITIALISFSSFAQVERSQLTSAIEEREPVDDLGDNVTTEEGTVRKLYFFTHIKDMANREIIHRWVYQGEEKTGIVLNIGSDDWRTYSSKNIPWQWQGEWEVQVWHGDLQLTSYKFNLNAN
jgi:hypothetical protein